MGEDQTRGVKEPGKTYVERDLPPQGRRESSDGIHGRGGSRHAVGRRLQVLPSLFPSGPMLHGPENRVATIARLGTTYRVNKCNFPVMGLNRPLVLVNTSIRSANRL